MKLSFECRMQTSLLSFAIKAVDELSNKTQKGFKDTRNLLLL